GSDRAGSAACCPCLAGEEEGQTQNRPTLRYAMEDDQPVLLGAHAAWLAIRSEDLSAVAKELKLTNLQLSSWSHGVAETAGTNLLFVAPPIRGWVLVIGNGLPYAPQDYCLTLLSDLSVT